MGARIIPTPSPGRKRGCWLKGFTLLASASVLTLAACLPTGTPSPTNPPNKSEQSRDQYRNCVKGDRRQATQDRCQTHVWGQTFGEDDPRWDCGHMGNWACGPDNKRERQENH